MGTGRRAFLTPVTTALTTLVLWALICLGLGASLASPFVFVLEVAWFVAIGFGPISLVRPRWDAPGLVFAGVVGAAIAGSIYAATRVLGFANLHVAVMAAGGLFGGWRLVLAYRARIAPDVDDLRNSTAAVICGLVAMLWVGSAYYFSGRMVGGELTFFGPMARDHAFHLALLGRLDHVVPPDNFVISGFPVLSYHFFGDLTIHLLASGMGFKHSLMDVYFRLYPSSLYFALGFLTYWVPARMFRSRTIGLIGAALLLFGGDFSWILGALQTLKAAPHPGEYLTHLFSPWVNWNGFGTIYPLIHRPAYYNGLTLFLAGLAVVIEPDRPSWRNWAMAGMIWGLMAGFNYTLSALLGVSLAMAAAGFAVRRDWTTAGLLALCGAALAAASVVANAIILSQAGMLAHQGGPGFVWAPGVFAAQAWGAIFGGGHGVKVAAAVAATLVISYGLNLVGIPEMVRARGPLFRLHPAVATSLAIFFVVSCAVAHLFYSPSYGGVSNNIMFLQPTAWLLALFAAPVLAHWVSGGRARVLKAIALAILLFAGPAQAFGVFNFSYKTALDPAFLQAAALVKREAGASDVVAFPPDVLKCEPILSDAPSNNTFLVSALTGLDAYYSNQAYSENFSVVSADGPPAYPVRAAQIASFAAGDRSPALRNGLLAQNVRWILLPDVRHVPSADGVHVRYVQGRWTLLELTKDQESAR